jgi:hypothetical protein
MEYLKQRWSERSTRLQAGMVLLLIAQILFPKYSDVINQVGIALGVTGMAVPDKSKPQI